MDPTCELSRKETQSGQHRTHDLHLGGRAIVRGTADRQLGGPETVRVDDPVRDERKGLKRLHRGTPEGEELRVSELGFLVGVQAANDAVSAVPGLQLRATRHAYGVPYHPYRRYSV